MNIRLGASSFSPVRGHSIVVASAPGLTPPSSDHEARLKALAKQHQIDLRQDTLNVVLNKLQELHTSVTDLDILSELLLRLPQGSSTQLKQISTRIQLLQVLQASDQWDASVTLKERYEQFSQTMGVSKRKLSWEQQLDTARTQYASQETLPASMKEHSETETQKKLMAVAKRRGLTKPFGNTAKNRSEAIKEVRQDPSLFKGLMSLLAQNAQSAIEKGEVPYPKIANLFSLIGVDLTEADLSGVDLSYVNLNDAKLTRANLNGANLFNANLNRVNLTGANLTEANLNRVNLSGVNLSNATLSGASLINARLNGTILRNFQSEIDVIAASALRTNSHLELTILQADLVALLRASPVGLNLDLSIEGLHKLYPNIDLSRTNLRVANLGRANLTGANLAGANLSWAKLEETNLTGANLIEANLAGAKLLWTDASGVDLRYADLTLSDMTNANLTGAKLNGANLNWANLSGATLIEATLIVANLTRTKLSLADLSRADLSGADLSEANLSRATLFGADLSGADLSQANLSMAILIGTDLSGANLRGADLTGAHPEKASNLTDADFTDAIGLSAKQRRILRQKGANAPEPNSGESPSSGSSGSTRYVSTDPLTPEQVRQATGSNPTDLIRLGDETPPTMLPERPLQGNAPSTAARSTTRATATPSAPNVGATANNGAPNTPASASDPRFPAGNANQSGTIYQPEPERVIDPRKNWPINQKMTPKLELPTHTGTPSNAPDSLLDSESGSKYGTPKNLHTGDGKTQRNPELGDVGDPNAINRSSNTKNGRSETYPGIKPTSPTPKQKQEDLGALVTMGISTLLSHRSAVTKIVQTWAAHKDPKLLALLTRAGVQQMLSYGLGGAVFKSLIDGEQGALINGYQIPTLLRALKQTPNASPQLRQQAQQLATRLDAWQTSAAKAAKPAKVAPSSPPSSERVNPSPTPSPTSQNLLTEALSIVKNNPSSRSTIISNWAATKDPLLLSLLTHQGVAQMVLYGLAGSVFQTLITHGYGSMLHGYRVPQALSKLVHQANVPPSVREQSLRLLGDLVTWQSQQAASSTASGSATTSPANPVLQAGKALGATMQKVLSGGPQAVEQAVKQGLRSLETLRTQVLNQAGELGAAGVQVALQHIENVKTAFHQLLSEPNNPLVLATAAVAVVAVVALLPIIAGAPVGL